MIERLIVNSGFLIVEVGKAQNHLVKQEADWRPKDSMMLQLGSEDRKLNLLFSLLSFFFILVKYNTFIDISIFKDK